MQETENLSGNGAGFFRSKKGKAVPLQTWSGPEGSRKLSFPDFVTAAQDGGKVSLTHRPTLPAGNSPGTHFCYRLSRPQGHSSIGRIMSMKNSNDTSWNRTSDLPNFLKSNPRSHATCAAYSPSCKPVKKQYFIFHMV